MIFCEIKNRHFSICGINKFIITLLVFYANQLYVFCQEYEGINPKIIEAMPYYNGADAGIALNEYFKKNFIYPEYAIKNNISGRVYVSFTVDANPWVKERLTNIYVVKGVHPSIDYAAILMVRNIPDKWQTGLSTGNAEPIKFTLPIYFNIENVSDNQITDSLDLTIIQLLSQDRLSLDSILYCNRPTIREKHIPQIRETLSIEELYSKEQLTITGKVFDNYKHPLQGVGIIAKGTTQGVITDEKGSFNLTFEKGKIISVSFIGFITEDLIFDKSQKKLKIFLREYHNN